MEILDGRRHDKLAERWKVRSIAEYCNGRDLHWGRLAHPDIAKDYAPDVRQQTNVEFRRSICELVDQWIASGMDGAGKNGEEKPAKRDVNVIPPGYDKSLFDVLAEWLGRNIPKTALMRTGKIAVLPQPPNLLALDSKGLVRLLSPAELKAYAWECAVYHFKELLDSPYALCLTRCRNPKCVAPYYVRARIRTKEIKRGAYCGNCIGVGAMERVTFGRQDRKQKLIALAANAWDAFKPSHQHPRPSDSVAGKVNKKLRPDMQIKGKWVTQNRKAIEAELEKRKHAKS